MFFFLTDEDSSLLACLGQACGGEFQSSGNILMLEPERTSGSNATSKRPPAKQVAFNSPRSGGLKVGTSVLTSLGSSNHWQSQWFEDQSLSSQGVDNMLCWTCT